MTDQTDRPMHAIVKTPDGYTAHLGTLEDCTRPECIAAATLATARADRDRTASELADAQRLAERMQGRAEAAEAAALADERRADDVEAAHERHRQAVCEALGGNLVDWPEAIRRVRKAVGDRDGQRNEVRRLRGLLEEHRQQLATTLHCDDPSASSWSWQELVDLAAATRRDADRAEERAEQAEEDARLALDQRQEMAAERYAWQERGDRAEAALARVREIADRMRHGAGPATRAWADKLTHALRDEQPAETCPGRETEPNRCTCDCEGCTHNCAAHQLADAQPDAAEAPCFHAAWVTIGERRWCADCHEWLDPEPSAPEVHVTVTVTPAQVRDAVRQIIREDRLTPRDVIR